VCLLYFATIEIIIISLTIQFPVSRSCSASTRGGGEGVASAWSFSDPEMTRRQWVASYKTYSVEGMVDSSLGRGSAGSRPCAPISSITSKNLSFGSCFFSILYVFVLQFVESCTFIHCFYYVCLLYFATIEIIISLTIQFPVSRSCF
jgi:hypothetical protein